MPVDPTVPYHCSFLLDKSGGILRLAIAWRRVGNADYGIYLASDPNPSMIEFLASYNDKGEIHSFLVSDKPVSDGKRWDEDHIDASSGPRAASEQEANILRTLANAFCDDWLESYGASEAEKLLRKVISPKKAGRAKGLLGILKSDLPIQVRQEKMPDLLENAKLTENDFLYAFKSHSHAAGGASNAMLLESKMKMFLELL